MIFKHKDNPDSNGLSTNWKPSFENELKLASYSFHSDEAFHRAFGEGRALDEKWVLWHFVGLILNRRFDPSINIITVRKDGELKALLSCSLNRPVSQLRAIFHGLKVTREFEKLKLVDGKTPFNQYHETLASKFSAVKNEQMEACVDRYFQLIRSNRTQHYNMPLHCVITMIAVDPAESGRGHLRSMLTKLIDNLQTNSKIECIEVSTYDQSKVEMYQHLGFGSVEEYADDGIKAWLLKLPLK